MHKRNLRCRNSINHSRSSISAVRPFIFRADVAFESNTSQQGTVVFWWGPFIPWGQRSTGFFKKRANGYEILWPGMQGGFGEIVEELYPVFQKYGVAVPSLRIRSMDTRWGSCLPGKGVITLNKRLLEAPRNCIEYVVMHELVSFYPSKSFQTFLRVSFHAYARLEGEKKSAGCKWHILLMKLYGFYCSGMRWKYDWV